MGGVMLVAGEISGDLHAANLLHELRADRPGLEAYGVGGERLAEEGLEVVVPTSELAVMGLAEVLRHLPRLRRVFRRVVDTGLLRRPDVAVLVDSPDFNLRLAKKLAPAGIPVVLYVSPQLWAWRQGRVELIRRIAREVLCILPFEVDFYDRHGVKARYVGHPLVDDFAREGLLERHDRGQGSGRLALLPGSREMEIASLLPVMLEAVRQLDRQRFTEIRLIEAPGMESVLDEALGSVAIDSRLRRIKAKRREALAECELAWTASGTATLETALLGVPSVVCYRLKPLSYSLAKLLVKVEHIALVNLIAGRRLVPELVQDELKVESLIAASEKLLGEAESVRQGLAEVRRAMGPPGASRRAAEAVLEHMVG